MGVTQALGSAGHVSLPRWSALKPRLPFDGPLPTGQA